MEMKLLLIITSLLQYITNITCCNLYKKSGTCFQDYACHSYIAKCRQIMFAYITIDYRMLGSFLSPRNYYCSTVNFCKHITLQSTFLHKPFSFLSENTIINKIVLFSVTGKYVYNFFVIKRIIVIVIHEYLRSLFFIRKIKFSPAATLPVSTGEVACLLLLKSIKNWSCLFR